MKSDLHVPPEWNYDELHITFLDMNMVKAGVFYKISVTSNISHGSREGEW